MRPPAVLPRCSLAPTRGINAASPTTNGCARPWSNWFAWSHRVVNYTYERPELVPDDLTLPHWSWDGPVE